MVTNLSQQVQEAQEQVLAEFQRKQNEEEYHDPTISANSFKIVETTNITTSLGGLDVPMFTITDFSHTNEEA